MRLYLISNHNRILPTAGIKKEMGLSSIIIMSEGGTVVSIQNQPPFQKPGYSVPSLAVLAVITLYKIDPKICSAWVRKVGGFL